MHTLWQDCRCLHDVEADGTLYVLFLAEIRQNTLGIHLAIAHNVLALTKSLD